MSKFRPKAEPGARFDAAGFFASNLKSSPGTSLDTKIEKPPELPVQPAVEKKETEKKLTYISAAFSIKKKKGKENQDGYFADDSEGFFGVLDGHHEKGHDFVKILVAMATSMLEENKQKLADPKQRQDAIKTFFSSFFSKGKERIPHKPSFFNLRGNIQTGDAVAAIVFAGSDGTVYIGTLGDCKVAHYDAKTKKLRELNSETGKVTSKGVIFTSNFSTGTGLSIEAHDKLLNPGDYLILTSDGASPILKNKDLAAVLTSGQSVEAKVKQLESKAGIYTENDDTTFVLVEAK